MTCKHTQFLVLLLMKTVSKFCEYDDSVEEELESLVKDDELPEDTESAV